MDIPFSTSDRSPILDESHVVAPHVGCPSTVAPIPSKPPSEKQKPQGESVFQATPSGSDLRAEDMLRSGWDRRASIPPKLKK